MLDLRFVRDNVDKIDMMLRNRRMDLSLAPLIELDTQRRRILREVEELKFRRNKASEEISNLKREKKDSSLLIEEMKEVSRRVKTLDQELTVIEEHFRDFLLLIPNMPHESVPVGADEKDNPVAKTWGSKPELDFEPKPHWEIGEALGILDFERAAKIAGARFALYWKMGAALRAR